MNNSNLNKNDINNIQQSNINLEPLGISEQTDKITAEESQYRYLKELNKKLVLFKKQSKQSETNDEATNQTMRW